MRVMFKVRFIYLLFALLLLVQPVVFAPQIVRADSWVFQDDFSGPLLWSKVISGYGPGSPPPPATTGDVAIEDGELHVKADYWWYQVHAVRTFSGVAGDFESSARCRIMSDSGDSTELSISVGAGPYSQDSDPNVLASFGYEGYTDEWRIYVQGSYVKNIAVALPKDTWVRLGIQRTATVLRFMVNGSEVFQYPAPPSAPIDRMALCAAIGVHWEGGPHVHFDDAGFLVGGECVETATVSGVACFATSNGTVEDLTAVAAPSGAPVEFPHGMFTFKITGLSNGEEVTLTVELPDPVPTGTKWWKYHNNTWSPMDIGDDDGDNIITVMLTDGASPDDEDYVAGQITDQGGPGYPGAVGWETHPIDKVRVLLPWIALAVILAGGMGWYILRRRMVQS